MRELAVGVGARCLVVRQAERFVSVLELQIAHGF